ncbi:MAG: AAA family ATPase [Desulfobacca sp.]|nr:AAA family ATPase [Desulfobacca sp.]
MNHEDLLLAVLYESDSQEPVAPELFKEIPQVRVMEPRIAPEAFLSQPQGIRPDMVLVVLKGEAAIPDWLDELLNSYPPGAIIVSSACRHPDFLIRIMQLGVREFLPFPLEPSDLKNAVARARVALKEERPPESRRGRILVVTGHKGGVGTTAIAINLSVALAELYPDRVVLVDLGRPFPDVSHFLNLKGTYSIKDLLQNVKQLDPIFVNKVIQRHESNLSIISGSPDFNGQQILEPESLEPIFGFLRTLYDWIVVDLSSWIDYIFINLLEEADQVLLLTELSIPDLRNLKKLWELLYHRNLSLQKVKLLINRYYKNSPLELKDVERLLEQPVSYTLTSDYPALIAAIDQGTSLSVVAPRSRLWRDLQNLAQDLANQAQFASEEEAAGKTNWLRRLLFRR